MLALLGILLLFSTCICERYTVPLNQNSSVFTSVASIFHDTSSRQFIIDLQKRRRCEKPVFHVRLSGSAVYLLNLAKHDSQVLAHSSYSFMDRRSSVYYFAYPELLDAGTYFLEVLVLFCAGFDPLNFVNTCLEDHWQGRNLVNAPYSFFSSAVPVGNSVGVAKTAVAVPRWKLSDKMKDDPTYTLDLLPTRYQSLYCGEGLVCEHHKHHSELWQYQLYDFVDAPDWRQAYDRLGKPIATVCFFGASHERELTAHARNLTGAAGVPLTFTFVEGRFPEDFQLTPLTQSHCDYGIIGYGQWPVSFQTNALCNADCFRTHMKNVIGRITKAAYPGPIKLFISSVNYNGMGTFMTSCPPFDHRSPPVIAMLNDVLKQLTTTHDVEYIDLNHIMGPMWDSALDYCHPRGKVFFAEAEWILHHIFTSTAAATATATAATAANNGTTSSGDSKGKAKSPTRLIRFRDSPAVYLVRDGVARAFPNGNTFLAMGFEWGRITVLNADERTLYTFGSDLPSL